ncbi:MAG: dihydrofolate reductase family protein [Gemmatimonadaceae bacterium]
MGTIVVQAFLTLDGVMQAPGDTNEDREGGFEHGGWQLDYDARMDKANECSDVVSEWESKTNTLLLGRKTYVMWAKAWGVWDENAPGLTGELTRRYNRVPKYVASGTLTKLDWKNSHLLDNDVPAAVKKLRAEREGEIRIWGSSQLIKSLAEHNLIDEYRLVQYPIVLGTGKKLFSDGFTLSQFKLAESRALKSGVVINTYRRSE